MTIYCDNCNRAFDSLVREQVRCAVPCPTCETMLFGELARTYSAGSTIHRDILLKRVTQAQPRHPIPAYPHQPEVLG